VLRRVVVERAVVLADHPLLVGDGQLRAVQQRLVAGLRGTAGGELEAVDGEIDDGLPPAGEAGCPTANGEPYVAS